MKCQDVRRKLQDYVLGETSKEERSSIEGHLVSCQECQKEEQIMRWLVVALESEVIEEPSADFVQSVIERLPGRVADISMKPLFAFLSLVLGGLLGLGFVFREKLLQLTGELEVGIAKALSGIDPEAFVSDFLLPKAPTIYFVALGFACLLVTITIIWFVRYYWEPVRGVRSSNFT